MYRPPPPPPPPPPSRPPQPSACSAVGYTKNEPYGAVPVATGGSSSMSRRRTPSEAQPSQPYQYQQPQQNYQQYSSPNYYMSSSPPQQTNTASSTAPSSATMHSAAFSSTSTRTRYQHNAVALFFVSPVLTVLWWNPSTIPLQVFLFVCLALYAMDLANERDMAALSVWIAFAILSVTNAWFSLGSTILDNSNQGLGGGMLAVVAETMLFLCLACLATLQFQWLFEETATFALKTERLLHSMLPPVSASIVTFQLTAALEGYWGVDRAATTSPFLFAILLTAGMLFIGCSTASFSTKSADDRKDAPFILSFTNARIHSALLLLVPTLMHATAFWRRIVSSYASTDEWYDLILVWSVPYLLQYGMGLLHHSGVWKGPYAMSASVIFPQSGNTLRGAVVPIVVSTLASLALQQRHLIPVCNAISYQFNGHTMPSSAVVSMFLSLSTVLVLLAIWVWGRTSATTGEPLFGEYHDDVVQLALGLSGMFAGKAVGMPWTLTPLPVLAFLGLSVWVTTRMLRFLAIVLFALHSAAALLLSYRFAGIDYTVVLSIGINLRLMQLGMAIVFESILVGFVTGLAVRPAGGVGSSVLKKFDIPGILLVCYGVFLTVLECTLLKEPVPFHELTDIETLEDVEVDPDATLYTPLLAMATSLILLVMTWFMRRFKIMSGRAAVLCSSIAIGKAVAVMVDMSGFDDDDIASTSNQKEDPMAENRLAAYKMLQRSLVATVTLVTMLAPSAFLTPVHVKTPGTSRYKRSLGPNGKPASGVPRNVSRIIALYSLVLLPAIFILAVPLVISPLIGLVSGRYSGAYYSVSPGLSELIGFASALWGASSLSMVNHYLPDGGGEVWKKASALTFLMGLGITLSAPTIPNWFGSDTSGPNPFATISSLGSTVVSTGRSKSGGWGLMASALAMLLALTGPLELRERHEPTGRKDKSLLLRLMIFSLLFGGGVAWFITLQFMSEERFLPVFLTTTASMSMAFFGTVAGVMGYVLELDDLQEVEQVVSVWAGAFPVFLVISATSEFVQEKAHPFGIGGWLSTYLFVCAMAALSFSMALRSRSTKNAATRGIGNLSCTVSWAFTIILLYGRFGISGLDAAFDVTLILGIPASVFGTCLSSFILLALEGESTSIDRRNRIQRVAAQPQRPKKLSYLGLNLNDLHRSNRFAPSVAATASVLVVASIYGVFFRGCGWMGNVPTSHEGVFASVYGMSSRTTSASGGDDLASLAAKNLVHSQAMVTAARLAGSGFWTADSIFGPLLHLFGIAATLPSLYLLIHHMWNGQKVPIAKATLALPLNLIPLVLCRGLPPLRAVAVLGGVGGVIQLLHSRHQNWQSRMSI